jgi:selenide,water dikinase
MGATPLVALNIVGFPKEGDLDVLGQILRGGAEKAAEAGVSVIGGHSIDDKEPKYGMAVTGVVHPDRIVTNAAARPGDALVLTKPLGTGIITTAIKRGRPSAATVREAIAAMQTLNRAASEAMVAVGVSACTDVTGYGLLGHLHEMLHASGASAVLRLTHIPVLGEVWDLVKQDVPGGTRNNLRFMNDKLACAAGVTEEARLVLADAQTSGGLLIVVSPDKLSQLLSELERRGVATRAVIGEIAAGSPGTVRVEA